MKSEPVQPLDGEIDIEALFNWISQQPELRELRAKADDTLCEYRPGEPSSELRFTMKEAREEPAKTGILQMLWQVIWVPGRNMRGKAFATPELDSSLNSVAKLMSISTLWDFFTTIPLFQFSLSGPLGIASGPMAAVLSFILLFASNVAGENSTDRRRGHESKATWSLMAFLLLCTAKTLFSGVGIDLWISSRAIAATFAAELASTKLDKDRAELKRLEGSGADFQAAKQGCMDLENQMKALDRKANETQFVSLFVRAYGPNAVTVADRGLTPKQLIQRYGAAGSIPGVCRQRDALQSLNIEKAQPLAAAIEVKQRAISGMPPLIYLQKQEPEIFAEHFRMVNGRLEWVNGSEAVGQATNQFYANLFAGKLGVLGFSLFSLAVSVILTGAAAIMIYLISLNKQVQASFSGELLEYRDAKLDEYQEIVTESNYLPPSPPVGSIDELLQAPIKPIKPITESEAFDVRSLRWLQLNARTIADKMYATKLYRTRLIELWRKYIAETGQSYYPKLRNDLMDHYKAMDY